MKTFILSLSATLLVMLITPPTTKVIQDKPVVKKQSIIQTLQAPVYAEKQQVAKVSVAPPKTAPVASGGSCEDYMRQAGVTDIPNAMTLVGRESNCRSTAQNPNSTAYGIMQFLDGTWEGVGCVKTSDPVEQLRCGQLYIFARYKSWAGAVAFWNTNHYY